MGKYKANSIGMRLEIPSRREIGKKHYVDSLSELVVAG